MVFNHFEFDPQVYNHRFTSKRLKNHFLLNRTLSLKKELFMNYVETSLKHFFHQHSSRFKKFDLTFCSYDGSTEQDFGRIDKWLNDVIHNGIHTLSLNILSSQDEPYPLPQCVLASHLLHELVLSGSLLIESCRDINLPSLRVLTLCNVHSVNDDLVKHLFSGCSFVEVLRIKECRNLVDLQVSSLVKLVELSLDSCSCIRTVEIGSLNFQSFYYISYSKFPPNITLLGDFKTLRKLRLEICVIGPQTQSPFHQLNTSIHLEELVLEYVDSWKFTKMKISSLSLKRLVIRNLLNMRQVVEIECPNLHELEYTSNLLPFHSLCPLSPKHFILEFHLSFQHAMWLDALQRLFENGFNNASYPKVFIVMKDHKEVIILDLDDGLIEVMLSFLFQVQNLESTKRIIIATTRIFVNLRNEILIPMTPYMAFNVVSSCTSNFTQIFSEKLSRIIESCGCIVEKDTTNLNIPSVLRQYLSSSCKITRIVSKWDWTI